MTRAHAAEPRRCRLALSLLVWALCALLGPGPALQALHFSLVQHRICPEHGELLHVGSEESSAAAAAAVSGSGRASSIAVTAASGTDVASAAPGPRDGGADSHDHDACGVSVLGSVAAVWPATAETITALAELREPRPARAERAHVGIALLDYAPKLEPPSLAWVCLSLDASVLV